MTEHIGLGISGASGRMGQALLELVRRDRRFRLKQAVVAAGSERIGAPVYASVSRDLDQGAPVFSGRWERAEDLRVVVDFSSPDGLVQALDACLAHKLALVTGTTGHDAALQRRLEQAAGQIPILQAANFSLGVAVLTRLLRSAAASLSRWDLEIIEAHHGRKEDAPSGTALALGRAAAEARGTTLEQAAVYSREGRTGPRASGSIGFAVVRGGDIVGEHTALLAGQGERVELAHRATDRHIFARGALEAAAWLAGRAPGCYDLDDMLADAERG